MHAHAHRPGHRPRFSARTAARVAARTEVPARRRTDARTDVAAGGRDERGVRAGERTGAAPARTRAQHRTARWTVPLLIGIAYGAYAWFLARDERFTTEATVTGLVAGAAAAVVAFALGRLRRPLVAEVRAAAYGAAFGCAIGYLSSLTGPSILWSSVLGLGIAAGVTPVVFYHLHTHEA
ncbi:hypothetical protein [Streptomyces armeniacus]|uniref:hypothetical protein n=1 Tax=Streptomyces armeniacus TaxID=83291 RepID=UPI001AD7EF92|nr:hypothetical protein [Streptomyces armeniacus]